MDSEAVWQAVLDAQKRTAQACARQEQGQRLDSPIGSEADLVADTDTDTDTDRDTKVAFAGDGDAFDQVTRLDAVAVRLCRHNQRTRLRIGEALAALGPEGHQELGFSTFGAYVAERCSRSSTWAARSRRVAKQLAELPLLHKALNCGELGWCMIELLCKYATPLTEASLLEMAREQTIRAMRQALETEDPTAAPTEDGAASDPDEPEPRRRIRNIRTLRPAPESFHNGSSTKYALG